MNSDTPTTSESATDSDTPPPHPAQPPTDTPHPRPRYFIIVALACILVAGLLEKYASVIANDSYMTASSRFYGRVWAESGLVLCLTPIAAGIASLIYLQFRTPKVYRITRNLITAALGSMGLSTLIGIRAVIETDKRGGHFGPIDYFFDSVFYVVTPLLLAALCTYLFLRIATLHNSPSPGGST